MSAGAAPMSKSKTPGGQGPWNEGHPAPPPAPTRHSLPDERPSITRKLTISGWDFYLRVGLYANGDPGEVFITIGKMGTVVRGDLDAWAIQISKSLQTGVPLQSIVDTFRDLHSEPNGWVEYFGNCPSIQALVVRWLEWRFLGAGSKEGKA
jgi:hypothetical protein